MIRCPCGEMHETVNEAISHAQPGDIIIVVPEAVTIDSVIVVSEPAVADFLTDVAEKETPSS